MTKKVKIGLCQLLVEGTEPDRNLERAVELIEEAANKKCDIILLPETLDFAWTHPDALSEAEPIPGKYSNILSEAAKKFNVYICAGLTEKKNGENYNTAIFIGKNGQILLKYHKINLLDVEFPYYKVGDTLNVIDTEFGKLGLNICADNYMDGLDIGHTLARMGAQFILSPSSWTVDYSVTEEDDPYEDKWIKPYKILAEAHGITVIGTTSVGYIVGGPYEGKKMVGCSLVVDENGIKSNGDFNEFAGEVIVVDVDIKERKYKGTQIGADLQNRGYK